MPDFQDIKTRADQQWQDLIAGPKPWIRVGTAMCGHAVGASDVLNALNRFLSERNVEAHIDEVGCLGLCYAEPLVDILKPGEPRILFGNVSPKDIPALVDEYLLANKTPVGKAIAHFGESKIEGIPKYDDLPNLALERRIALRNAGHIAPSSILQYIANDGYAALNKAISEMNPSDVIKEMTDSGLRGRGGAGFPTGVKWSFMVQSPGPLKYILCNCEEGDPGAYNDKGILESDPHKLLEGMILAGYATNASNGIVFIRHGHNGPIDRIKHAIEQAYEIGLLGKNILGSTFSYDIEISLTGESYVAGEETALMDSIEGKRAMPRFKPPFPASFGVWGKPSTVNNVKSISYAPEIILNGSNSFKDVGTEKCTGTIIICLSGDIKYPGMYEVPMGTRLGEIVEQVGGGIPGGKKFKMLQLGGPLGHILNSDCLDLACDFDVMRDAGAMLGSGGIIVGNQEKCAVDLARVLVAFCQYESCGKCFPCRLGMTNLLDFVERIARFEGKEEDLKLMDRVGKTMEAASLCFHGQLGYNPLRSALVNFETDFRIHLEENRCPTESCLNPLHVPKNTRPFGENFKPAAELVQLSRL